MGFRAHWVHWRNRRLSDPRFQAWAARFPLTRPIARRQSAALFDTVAGFVYSQVLAAFVDLDLIQTIGTGTIDQDKLASTTGLPVAGADRLLKAGAAIGLVESVGDGMFALGPHGAALLGNPGISAMVAHHRLLYADLADPVRLLREGRGKLAEFWPYGRDARAAEVESYSALMAASQRMVAEQVLAAYDFGRHRHLLDIGGGEGAFLDAVAARHPRLQLSLLDLPAVAERARARSGGRVAVSAGDFLTDRLPEGADLISLIRILHDHDDDAARTLVAAAADALPPGGRLLIAEPMADAPGARAMGDGYFGMYLLAMGSGRPRRSDEIGAMILAAGFRRWRRIATPLPVIASIIIATL